MRSFKRVKFRDSAERMLTLTELCDLIGGRAVLLPELKSRFDGDDRLAARVAALLSGYKGPVAPMSFDPVQLQILRRKAPKLPRGVVAAQYKPHPYWDQMPPRLRYRMGLLLPSAPARPQFVAYMNDNLPALAPWLARHILCLPLIAWVVRTQAQRQLAARYADQVIFEGFRP